ncbi:prepilin peptidase [Microvirga flavescens]|uniref:prepilin peptidase n=1 Tax=Microvirga flavescens TaxID=2249811 RepID=UPI0013008E95|nr:A24 family peptidase [Microvirga flavescens]
MTHDNVLLSIAALYLASVSLAISVVDARRLVIPNTLNVANLGGGFAFAALLKTSLLSSMIGGAVGFAALLVFRSSYQNMRGQEGLGLGDVKFMAGAGLWVGWQGLAPLLLVASLSALIFFVLRAVVNGHSNWRKKLPFGPFLCAGTMIVWSIQVAGHAPWVSPP